MRLPARHRLWVLFAYVFAIACANGWHDHPHESHDAGESHPICHTPGTHVESDHAHTGDDHAADCPVCHFQGQPQFDGGETPALVQSLTAYSSSAPPAVISLALRLGFSGRAPPIG